MKIKLKAIADSIGELLIMGFAIGFVLFSVIGIVTVIRLGVGVAERQVFLNKRDQICIRVISVTDENNRKIGLQNNGRTVFNCEY